MEENRRPKNKNMKLPSSNYGQRSLKHTLKKRSLLLNGAGKIGYLHVETEN
jgi:hypothetical protein